jgi:hypothetical protein
MKNYDTGLSNKALASVVVACLVTAGVFAVAIYLPGIPGGPTTPVDSLGARVADYINSKDANVDFYWMSNCSLIGDLTTYYDSQHSGAFVDGVYINKTDGGYDINVLFAPYEADIVGTATISGSQWASVTSSLVDDGIGQMEENVTIAGDEFPRSFPVDLFFYIYFNDSTFLYGGFTESDGNFFVRNGTWNGFTEWGHPNFTGWIDEGIWLSEAGHMAQPMVDLYTLITSNVSYP